MAPTTFTFQGRDGATITAYRWVPDGEPRGIVQLAHGMGEHLLRYDDLATSLAAAGFLVAGQDHRGHGATAVSEADHGKIGAAGWTELVNDIHVLAGLLHAEHPGLPLVLVGHSLGSFAAQRSLLDPSDEVTAVALSSPAAIASLEPAIDLDQPMDLAAFNAPFAPARPEVDWLSPDRAPGGKEVADSRC